MQTIRLTACVTALLVAGGTAWAQPVPLPPEGAWSSYTPVAHYQPPAPPLPPPIGPCPMMGPAAPGMPGFCAWVPVPAPSRQENATNRTTVAELMRLYRMLYKQGKREEAGIVAQAVCQLDPLLGRTALVLAVAQASAPKNCCTTQAFRACGTGGACGVCCCTQAATPCACKTCKCDSKECKCGKGDSSACGCAKGCKCSVPKKTTSRPDKPCRKVIGLLFQAGLPCPLLLPLPMVGQVTICPNAPVASMEACTATAPCCPTMGGCCMPAPTTCCCDVPTSSACQPAKPTGCGTGEDAPVTISAAGNRVCVKSPAVTATCDRITTQGSADRVILEGNVQVDFCSPDRPGTIVADRIAVGLSDGTYDVDCLGNGKPFTASYKATAGYHNLEGAIQPAAFWK
jgi:hypothetical protein